MAKKDNQSKASKKFIGRHPLFILVGVLFLLIIIGIGVFSLITPQSHKNLATNIKKDLRFNENRTKEADEELLLKKDFNSYQYSLLFYVDNYLSKKDYKNAERVLDEILTNVPSEQIKSETYIFLNILYKDTKNHSKYEMYTKKLIERLKQENRNQDATFYEKELKESS